MSENLPRNSDEHMGYYKPRCEYYGNTICARMYHEIGMLYYKPSCVHAMEILYVVVNLK